jgi:hypothetical protein
MKKFFITLLSVASLASLNASHAVADVVVDQLKAEADAEYHLRDFNSAGVAHVQIALGKYQKLQTMITDQDQLALVTLGVARSLYFIGDATADKAQKKVTFQSGMDTADIVLKNYGILKTDVATLTPALAQELSTKLAGNKLKSDILVEALYEKAANLGQWGQTDVVGALFRWPELRNIADFITKITYVAKDKDGKDLLVSYKSTHDYAPYRIVGRGFYVIPPLLGGDKQRSEKYMEAAVKGTTAVDASGKVLAFSYNGYNNNYYADVLRANGKTQQAKDLLTAFVAADLKDSKIFPNNQEDMADLVQSQSIARDNLSKF